MNDPLATQSPGVSLTDLLLVGAAVLVALIYLYRKLRPRSGRPVCASCPSERRCPATEGRPGNPREDHREP